jgi:predicted phage terminase large subunit-like protein
MGFHAHAHVVDDPIDPQKAISDIEIEKANTWLIETLSTRKVEKIVTPLILVMQRLAQNDPTGYMTNRGVGKIRQFCIPAELTDDVTPPELKKKYVDGLMDPIRIPRAVLEEEKEKGDYFYSSQFLQNPIPLGGGMFVTKNLVEEKSYPGDHHFKQIVRCWDNAGSPKGNKHDRRRAFTVGVKMGIHKDGSFWIIDVIRGRYKTHQREMLKKITAQLDGLHVEIVQEQEGGSGGQESAEYTIRNLAGFRVKAEQPKGDKTMRADAFSAQVNKGNFHYVKAAWNHDYIEEMKHFPFSTYKDQIDASSAAFQRLFIKKRRVGALFRRKDRQIPRPQYVA